MDFYPFYLRRSLLKYMWFFNKAFLTQLYTKVNKQKILLKKGEQISCSIGFILDFLKCFWLVVQYFSSLERAWK